MSTLKTNLRTMLLANSTVSARVGGSRIYDLRLNERPELPAIAMMGEMDMPVVTHSSATDLNRPIVSLYHFAETGEIADAMEKETRAVLEGFRGDMGTFEGVTILRISTDEDIEPELGMAYTKSDYQIWHNN